MIAHTKINISMLLKIRGLCLVRRLNSDEENLYNRDSRRNDKW